MPVVKPIEEQVQVAHTIYSQPLNTVTQCLISLRSCAVSICLTTTNQTSDNVTCVGGCY